MFGLSNIRLGIYAAAALAVAFLVWRTYSLTGRLAVATLATEQAQANLVAEQASRAKERKLQEDASNDYENRLKALNVAKAATPVRDVRLCKRAPDSVPATPTAASGVAQADRRRLPDSSGFVAGYGSGVQTGIVDRWSDSGPDIGPQL